ncbi:CPBP family intramembrane glutamic endopeptidase [Asticcacaulis solisilvae]|uniref:CPBP family intramembrane glutamic endopeptidase n=1 Tax=Asticcacaulis solisilvae TaxID=1217274 RepID=UPI003FD875A3
MSGFELYAPRDVRHRRTWTAAAIPLTVVFIVLATFPVAICALVLHIPLQTGVDWRADAYQLYGFIFIYGVFFLWLWAFERRGPATIGFSGPALLRYLRGLAIGGGFLVAVVGTIWALGGYRMESAGFWGQPGLAAFAPVIVLLGGFMVQGGAEEVATRGYLMQVVSSRHGIVWGIVANTVVFSVLHALNIPSSPELLLGLVNILLVGVFLSLYAVHERSLWGVCAWHSAWNWLLGVGFGLRVSGETLDVSPLFVHLGETAKAPWWLSGGHFGPEGSVVTSLVLLMGTAYLLYKGALRPENSHSATESGPSTGASA